MPHLPIRLAILECGSPPPKANAKFGGYAGCFKNLLSASCDHPSSPLKYSDLSISVYDIENHPENYPSLDSIDAILTTGSKHDSYRDDAWIVKLVQFNQEILKQGRVRIIGVCFGHQILARALGARVGKSDRGWEVSVLDMQLSTKGKEIFGKETLVRVLLLHSHTGYTDRMKTIQQMHQDIAYSYPEGVEALASTDKCEVQAMYAPKRLISVQGHPEFTGEIVREICETRLALKVFDEPTYESAIERVDNDHDGLVIGRAFLRFLVEE